MPNGSTQPLKIKVPQEVEVLVEIACINVEMCLCAVYMSVECIQDNFSR
jgi:hypothetical protein